MADADAEVGASRIDLAATPDFELGRLCVRPAHRHVRSGDAFCRELEPRVMQVLVALASARPGVVSRDRLIAQCWNGRIVGDDAINRCIVALRHLTKEIEPPPFAIETVPRVGYSLVLPNDDGLADPSEATPAPGGGAAPWRRWLLGAIGTVIVASALLLAFFLWRTDRAGGMGPPPAMIAVLPFRNLSNGDPYFAEGISEEILGRLAREPQFRVAGRTSSSMFEDDADVREVGRKLRVKYVLEGSVRTQAGRVRVNVALVQVSDGIQLWSNSYDGSLDDIFAIQRQIGGAIAGTLKRKLVHEPPSGPLVTSGDVYSLYLTARGLLRKRSPPYASAAADLLRRAVELDPDYAPAWSSLGLALRLQANAEEGERYRAMHQEAIRHIRHALALAPNLAEAHGALGMALDFGSREARAHIRRAAQLDPNSAENMFWLGNAFANTGEFEKQLASYRRAAQLDPFWFMPHLVTTELAVAMGESDQARAWLKPLSVGDPDSARLIGAYAAFLEGDFSRAVREWVIAAKVAERPSSRSLASRYLDETLWMLGLPNRDRPTGYGPATDALRIRMETPSRDLWRARNSDPIVSNAYLLENLVGAKLLLNAGRHRELLPYYDSDIGLLGLSSKQDPRDVPDLETRGALVALALRQNGRVTEADRLLSRAAAMAETSMRGRVPSWFYASTAEIWALQGRKSEALSALERAVARGWTHSRVMDLLDINDEPAFRAIRGDPRFQHVRARLKAHMDRERRETASLAI